MNGDAEMDQHGAGGMMEVSDILCSACPPLPPTGTDGYTALGNGFNGSVGSGGSSSSSSGGGGGGALLDEDVFPSLPPMEDYLLPLHVAVRGNGKDVLMKVFPSVLGKYDFSEAISKRFTGGVENFALIHGKWDTNDEEGLDDLHFVSHKSKSKNLNTANCPIVRFNRSTMKFVAITVDERSIPPLGVTEAEYEMQDRAEHVTLCIAHLL
jgi:hypothetical protein